jgi:type VI secretion system protein ImpA
MIDNESLLTPIADGDPSGRDLRLVPGDQTLDKAKELRTSLDPALDPAGKGREPNWPELLKLCEGALRTQTKDLEILGWLVEALAHVDGFPGLEQGLDLVARSLTQFWESIHPGVDEDGIALAIRARPLSWLGSSADFLRAVKGIAIARTAEGAPLSWSSYEGSQRLDDQTLSPERRSELIELDYISGEQWELGISGVSAEALRAHAGLVASCEEKVEAIEKLCADRFAEEEPPNLHPLRSHLGELREYLEGRIAGSAGAGATQTGEGTGEAPAQGQAAAQAQGPIANRQDALRKLREVADYFRRIEPHSPVPYLVDRAVRWGEMPLEELLVDLTRNDGVLAHMRETLGLDGGPKKKD